MTLRLEKVHVHYDGSEVLRGVSLQVEPKQIVCLIGRNGVGKSTTLKAVMGLAKASSGRITYNGDGLVEMASYQIARRGLGYVPEDRRVFGPLTVLQNLQVAMRPARSGLQPWTLEHIYEVFPVLGDRAGQRAESLSGGEQQMLTTARTLMGNPELVLIDEPNEGLAPMYVERMNRMIREANRRGAAVLLVEQSMTLALSMSHRAYVMSKGEIVFDGSAAELEADPKVRKRYLEL